MNEKPSTVPSSVRLSRGPTEAPSLKGPPGGWLDIRLLKALMVLSVGLWGVLVAADNLLDYDSNWQFVRHVLSMDTVFPDNRLRYRAITDPTHHRHRMADGASLPCRRLAALAGAA